MKILYVITKADIKGAQTHLIQLANYFSKKYQVYVAVGNNGPMLQKLNSNIKIIRLKHLKGPIDIKEDILGAKELAQLIRLIKPKILHLHSSKAGTLGRLAYICSEKYNTHVIFTAHSWAFTEGVKPLKRFLFKQIEKWLLRVTDKVICVSDYDRQLALRNNFDGNKLITLHNSVKQSQNQVLDKVESIKVPPVRFVMVARFEYPKLHEMVIKGIQLLKQSTDRLFDLTFIGDGLNLEACKAQVAALGLTPYIKFLGNVYDVKASLYQYDVFVLISKHEGLPISIIEAMSEGLPIIASDVGGINELINDNGILVENNTPKAIAIAMKTYFDQGRIKKDILKSYNRYLDKFTEDKMLKKLETIYESKH
ncbi:glycosyltransferase family 4 protein [Staphylococcus sp. IVB6181]|uniref:glycosyltransferase family 4 protein n=1 Tax=Staphylococcus sp. IVB6181 TaxID=2929481 RepID=UPI0021D33A66|nr:glycosyltransferase family 4 protein [Staphylococcus sp. IVB6181]UXV34171.1 glycosyltransferase family 4 protein [Staphylococcus sp. IVB6181]